MHKIAAHLHTWLPPPTPYREMKLDKPEAMIWGSSPVVLHHAVSTRQERFHQLFICGQVRHLLTRYHQRPPHLPFNFWHTHASTEGTQMLRNRHGNANRRNRRFRLVTRFAETSLGAQSAPRARLLTSHSASILRSTRPTSLHTPAHSPRSLGLSSGTTNADCEGSSFA